MAYWLLVAILAYLFFSLSSLGDKLFLSGKPKPISYVFYVGVFSIFVVLFIPFVKFGFPDAKGLFWIVLDAFIHLLGLYTMFVALEKFDVSKTVATIGATQPIFIFILTWLFFGPQYLPMTDIIALALLFIGSVIISIEKTPQVTFDFAKITILSSLLFSLDYIFSKMVFMDQSFFQGIIWIRIFVLFFVLFLLLSKKFRKEIFAKKVIANKNSMGVFLFTQLSGGAANFLQSLAVALTPVAFLAIMNSLRGIQYVFLFLITLFISFFFPKILRESISRRAIIQKIVSIVLITIGLAILIY